MLSENTVCNIVCAGVFKRSMLKRKSAINHKYLSSPSMRRVESSSHHYPISNHQNNSSAIPVNELSEMCDVINEIVEVVGVTPIGSEPRNPHMSYEGVSTSNYGNNPFVNGDLDVDFVEDEDLEEDPMTNGFDHEYEQEGTTEEELDDDEFIVEGDSDGETRQ